MSVLVTGAAGGIGSAMCRAFEQAGEVVLRHDLHGGGDGKPMDVTGDLNDPVVRELIRSRLDEEADLNVVVAAHGIAGAEAIATIRPATTARIMAANTLSVLRLYDSVGGALAARDGAFVVVASQAGLTGEANNAVYCASKFALIGWLRGVDHSRTDQDPRIRMLCPGATDTPLLRDAFQGMADSAGVDYQDILKSRLTHIPAGRLGRTVDLAAATVWLAQLRTRRSVVAAVTGGEVLF
jgi:NAD(P)-dependent dehydrogenase (short-subunit alcohol dehydrogenase family)